jgi:hypothetical protein
VSLVGASERLAARQTDAKLAASAAEDVIVVEGLPWPGGFGKSGRISSPQRTICFLAQAANATTDATRP